MRRCAVPNSAKSDDCFIDDGLAYPPWVIAPEAYLNVLLRRQHSHTVSKKPKAAGFPVQEEHGGAIRAVETEETLHIAGSAALRAIGPPLYARANFVRANEGS
jgi:hypothetical protein